MNLSVIAGHDSGIQEGSKEYGDIMHEFFHTLGMLHEHQHPERKFTISETGPFTYNLYRNLELMDLPAVGMDMEDQGWSKKNIRDNIVQKLKPNDIGPYSPLADCSSCMKWALFPGVQTFIDDRFKLLYPRRMDRGWVRSQKNQQTIRGRLGLAEPNVPSTGANTIRTSPVQVRHWFWQGA